MHECTGSTWDTEKVDIMSNIREAKFSQVEPFQKKIKKCGSKHVTVEATYDNFWGSGLNEEANLKSLDRFKYTGKNHYNCG